MTGEMLLAEGGFIILLVKSIYLNVRQLETIRSREDRSEED